MKKLFTLLCTLVLGASLSYAAIPQDTGSKADTSKQTEGKKGHKGAKKGHKGGKKSKKGASTDTTTPPPK